MLLQYGFTRERPPEGTLGSSAYSFSVAPGRIVTLWGFGLFYGDAELAGLFLRRSVLSPRLTPGPSLPMAVWSPDQLPLPRVPRAADERRRARSLLAAALLWMSAYEGWVVATLGLEYRRRCLADWPQTVRRPEQMPEELERLAEQCEATPR